MKADENTAGENGRSLTTEGALPNVMSAPGDTPPPEGSASDERWLWIDPLEPKARPSSGSVLLAEDIKRYTAYNVLINKHDFSEGQRTGAKLKGASYTMTPHPTEAWTFEKDTFDNIVEKPLKKGSNSDGEYYVVPKNSLVFIKLKQELRIPFYMIGRHNLKIRYVYKGLLLGTGPQVDPGYVGNLIIPLHNFTTEDVFVHIESSFVSIDFVRTSPLFEMDELVPETIDQLYQIYEKAKCLIERDKVEKRKSLAKYLEGSKPQSQLGKIEYAFGRLQQETKKALESSEEAAGNVERAQRRFESDLTRKWERSRLWKGFEVVAAVGVLGLLLNLYRLQERDIESRGLDLRTAMLTTNFANYQNRLDKSDMENKASAKANTKTIEEFVAQMTASQSTIRSNLSALEETSRTFKWQWTQLTNSLQKIGVTNSITGPR